MSTFHAWLGLNAAAAPAVSLPVLLLGARLKPHVCVQRTSRPCPQLLPSSRNERKVLLSLQVCSLPGRASEPASKWAA